MAEGSDDDDDDSKTLEPTEKKINDALDKGNLPVAREGPLVAMLVALIGALATFATVQSGQLAGALSLFFAQAGAVSLNDGRDALQLLSVIGADLGLFLAPFLVLFVALGLAVTTIPKLPRMVLDRIVPKGSHISPMAGFKRIYGEKGLMEFAKSLFKVTLVVTVLVLVLRDAHEKMGGMMLADPRDAITSINALAMRVVGVVLVASVALFGFDLVWSHSQWIKDLRMTHKDMKDELKESDGDPMFKARRQQRHRAQSSNRMMAAVPSATVIITNPTHFAVALRYDANNGGVPEVIAKGQDLVAEKIKALGAEHGVPMVEDVPLARGLYRSVEIGQYISPEFYRAIAEIVHYLGQTRHGSGPLKGQRRTV